ncbi:Cys-tRNA(Pro) deacylase [Magnetospirillum aberrantis]|uniref:Cys-tRNA(Pro)/Cys-tRNA(Cys) deacylase n=1 Tax=Magnetospirillum aberrantis SpK TaxID=908842 RepID=A0A7C9QW30_9PROT|nr:Cys-tRNA(Pro) deacylase [Magnetospirillum aberrantis]NFV81985.1 Cys-tRNA(Pro) deacylase [Magnetospirillum aberrantis SpK]
MSRKTPATTAMDRAKKPYELLEYQYDPDASSIGLHAAQSMGLPPSLVFKTLMTTAGDEALIAVVPSDHELNLKALAHAAGKKSVAMMKIPDAERLSGYKVGGVSPLGQKKRLRTFFDASALTLPFIVVNGGQRGLQIKATAADLIEATGAMVADIATQ